MVTDRDWVKALAFPAVSLACALIAWTPADSRLDLIDQLPVASALAVPMTVAPSYSVTVVPANAAARSGGTRRLMGWLLRSLQQFGEQLVFENVLDDGRVELILMDLFDELFSQGALIGQQVTDAVTITRSNPAPNAVEFDIKINAAVALETIQLSFADGTVTSSYALFDRSGDGDRRA